VLRHYSSFSLSVRPVILPYQFGSICLRVEL